MSSSTAEKLLLELQNQYLTNLPSHIDEVEQLCLSLERSSTVNDYQDLLRKVHSIKGSGGTYGFQILTTICHQLEDYLSTLDPEQKPISKNNTDIMMQYVDLIRDTQQQLADANLQQQLIETRLHKIKKQSNDTQHSVLVIDPAQSVIAIYREALQHQNIVLSSEQDALTALSRLMIEKFDLIITAREFSRMTSDALVAALRLSINPNRDVPVILVSSGQRQSSEAIAAPTATLSKSPKLPAELAETVKKHLH